MDQSWPQTKGYDLIKQPKELQLIVDSSIK